MHKITNDKNQERLSCECYPLLLVLHGLFAFNHGLASSAFSWANTVTFVALNSSTACTQLLVSPQVSNAIFCVLLSPNTSSALEKPPAHF